MIEGAGGQIRRVTVRWVDSSILYEGGWADREALQRFMSRESLSVESCGFLLDEGEEALLLASAVSEDPPRVLGALVVPKVAILEVRDLEPSPTDDEETSCGERLNPYAVSFHRCGET